MFVWVLPDRALGQESTRPLIVNFRPAVSLVWSFFAFAFKMEGLRKRYAFRLQLPR